LGQFQLCYVKRLRVTLLLLLKPEKPKQLGRLHNVWDSRNRPEDLENLLAEKPAVNPFFVICLSRSADMILACIGPNLVG
jgi:hypothetical protein